VFTLYYAPDNASMIVRLALEETGLPYRTTLVDRRMRAQDCAPYRAINPVGLIPALETPEGTLFETGAILLWLADRVPGQLAPAPSDPARGDFLKWLFFIANTPHAEMRQIFHPGDYVPASAIEAYHHIMTTRMIRHFGLLETACADNPDLFAPPSVLTAYLGALLRWAAIYPEDRPRWLDLAQFPALAAMAAALEARPATRRVADAEGLGPAPFTAPTLACPPEGSAT